MSIPVSACAWCAGWIKGNRDVARVLNVGLLDDAALEREVGARCPHDHPAREPVWSDPRYAGMTREDIIAEMNVDVLVKQIHALRDERDDLRAKLDQALDRAAAAAANTHEVRP